MLRAREHARAEHLELDRDEGAQRREIAIEDRERQHVGGKTRATCCAERHEQGEIIALVALVGSARNCEPGRREPVELAWIVAARDDLLARAGPRAASLREDLGDRSRRSEIVRSTATALHRIADHVER